MSIDVEITEVLNKLLNYFILKYSYLEKILQNVLLYFTYQIKMNIIIKI